MSEDHPLLRIKSLRSRLIRLVDEHEEFLTDEDLAHVNTALEDIQHGIAKVDTGLAFIGGYDALPEKVREEIENRIDELEERIAAVERRARRGQ